MVHYSRVYSRVQYSPFEALRGRIDRQVSESLQGALTRDYDTLGLSVLLQRVERTVEATRTVFLRSARLSGLTCRHMHVV